MKKFAMALAGLVCLTGSAIAADNDQGDTRIRILIPLNLTDNDSLDFGDVAQINTAACDVTITPGNAGGTRTTVGCDLAGEPTGGDDATWNTTGEPGFLYDLTLSSVTTMAGPGAAIVVDTFEIFDSVGNQFFPGSTSGTVSGANIVLDAGGNDVFSIGATAHLAASQTPGVYLGTYVLTASYL